MAAKHKINDTFSSKFECSHELLTQARILQNTGTDDKYQLLALGVVRWKIPSQVYMSCLVTKYA